MLLSWILCTPVFALPPNTGAEIVATQGLLNYMIAQGEPLIAQELSNLQLPDENEKDGHIELKLSGMHTENFVCSNCIAAAFTSGALSFAISNFGLTFVANCEFKDRFIHGHVGVTVTFSGATARTSVTATANSNGWISVAAGATQVDLGNVDVKIHGGGLIGDILKLLKGVIEGKIKKAIQSGAASAISNVINTNLNADLQRVHYLVPLPNTNDHFATLRLQLTGPPLLTSGLLTLTAYGSIIPGPKCPPLPPTPSFPTPNLPQSTSTSEFLTLYLSETTLDDAIWVFAAGGRLSSTITHNAIPAGSPFTLNTTDISAFAPGLSAYPNMWMQVVVSGNVTTPPSVVISTSGVTATVGISAAFQVITASGRPAPAFTVGCQAGVSGTLFVINSNNNLAIGGKVSALTCDISLISTAVGPVRVDALSVIFDFVVQQLVIPELNAELANGFQIPPLPAGMKVVNLALTMESGYASIATSLA